MYRLNKEQGHNANVSIENINSKAQVVIGRITIDMLNTLEKADIIIGDTSSDSPIKLKDEWRIPLPDETAKELMEKAMKMKKPIRDQSIKTEPIKKEVNKTVDAMDVLLGLASYK